MAWYNASWNYRVKVTVQNGKVDADLTNFPVYVDLSGLPAGFHTNVNQTDGRDIRVTKADGTTELPREVVFYTAASDTGELHFKADALANATDTDFYIYYGNAAASDCAVTDTYGARNVWSTYTNVWHLDDYNDSATTNNLTKTGTINTVDVKVGKGQDITADGSYFTFGTALHPTGNWTMEWWAQMDNITYGVIFTHSTAAENYIFLYPGNFLETNASTVRRAFTNITSFTTLKHYVLVNDGTYQTLFVNGSQLQQLTATTGFTWERICGYATAGISFTGNIDEVRYLAGTKTSTWISTEYNNQNSPSTFFTIGSEENAPSGGGGASGPANLKSYNTNLKANIKSINGNLIANCKSLNGNI